MKKSINILVSVNNKYVEQLEVLLKSIIKTNNDKNIEIYIMHRELNKKNISYLKQLESSNFKLIFIKIKKEDYINYPVYEKRYPVEIYFRLIAVKYLPSSIDRILYLDSDIVVINKLDNLYKMDFEENLFIAATHAGKYLQRINKIRLHMKKENKYINTGVLLMNLEELRKLNILDDINKNIINKRIRLLLPDQDILSTLYGNRIKIIDYLKYNIGERDLIKYNIKNKNKIDIDWIKKNTVIIHYYGKNKPWNKKYRGKLNIFYQDILK